MVVSSDSQPVRDCSQEPQHQLAASFSPDSSIVPEHTRDSYKISVPQQPVHSGFMGAPQYNTLYVAAWLAISACAWAVEKLDVIFAGPPNTIP